MQRLILFVGLIAMVIWASGCKSTRHVPQDEYLLASMKIETEGEPADIKKATLKRYVRQHPNSKVLGLKIPLGFYNLTKPNASGKFAKWLQRVGEPPEIYSETLTSQSLLNIHYYLKGRGFYHNTVSDSVYEKGKQKKHLRYKVDYGAPILIDTLLLVVQDTAADRFVQATMGKTLLRPGARLDAELLDRERKRIEEVLRAEGFYNFSRELVGFVADTLHKKNSATLTMRIPNVPIGHLPPNVFRRYYVDSVIVYPDYNDKKYLGVDTADLTQNHQRGLTFLSLGKPKLRSSVVDNLLLLKCDSIVRAPLVQKSQMNFQSLPLFRSATLDFRERPLAQSPDSLYRTPQFYPIDCYLYLSRLPAHAYQIELMLTTSGSVGMEGSFAYRHRNLFHGAEELEISFTAQVESIRKRKDFAFKTALEFGVGASITFPRFIVPIARNVFVQRYRPHSRVWLSYNYQRRPDYTRELLSAGLAFGWGGASGLSHTFVPVEANVISISSITENFAQRIMRTHLAYAYQSQIVSLSSYSVSYNRFPTFERPHGLAARLSLELSGNVLYGFHKWLAKPNEEGQYSILKLPFSQYVKGDLNLAYTYRIQEHHAVALRFFAGAGFPYLNAKALPFEKQFFQGGANGVRAWHARDLGPGSYREEGLIFPNQTGDMKLEANIEYRFPLFWKLESALFIDAGNIWALNPLEQRPGALFNPATFFRQIAMGYGTGLRLNLGFFILRMDLGIKLHDPALSAEADQKAKHWIPFERGYESGDFVFHFGVGYPF